MTLVRICGARGRCSKDRRSNAGLTVIGQSCRMPQYLRPRSTGGRVFFTLCLATRGSDLLLREVDRLRHAVAQVRAERPFGIAGMGGAAGSSALYLADAAGGWGLCGAVGGHQGAVFDGGVAGGVHPADRGGLE